MTQDTSKAVLIWEWKHAPIEYRALSTNGGDEDYVAFVPARIAKRIDGDTGFVAALGACAVDEYEVKGGIVYIGVHA